MAVPRRGPSLPVEQLADRLIQLYTEAEHKLDVLIAAAANRGAQGTSRYFTNQQARVTGILADLRRKRAPISAALVPSAYRTGTAAIDRVIPASAAFSGVHTAAMEVLAANLEGNLRHAEERVGREANDVFRQTALEAVAIESATGLTPRQQARDYEQRLRAQGVTGFVDKRGRRWSLSTYASMVTRTTTREAASVGMANRMREHGKDLVEITKHLTSCPICKLLEGRTYSLSGTDPTYPHLDKLPPFHPNCRHVLVPAGVTFEAIEKALGLGPDPTVFENVTSTQEIKQQFAALPDDAELWVFHSTDPDTADEMLANGVDPAAKPVSLARERFEAGEEAVFAPGAGLSPGLTVAAKVGDTGGYGRRQLAIRVQKRDIEVSPEQANFGVTDPGEALAIGDAQVVKRIDAADVREVTLPGKDPAIIEDVAARIRAEPERFDEVPAEKFKAEFAKALADPRFGKFLTDYSIDDFRKMKCYLSPDGKTGGALKPVDGKLEAVSIFNLGGAKGAGSRLLNKLIADGANRLDCIGETLRAIYERLGFKVVETLKWDDKYAPDGWDYAAHERPNVYVMER